ncbi:hypothetical protein ABT160_32920 [Streptomyces sp. NPDC001941]|uniref:hypothetical protein n=1 Tax=Streptomyces sp. NPDC001941 TaxID=3154659 RepID=UPI003334753D
MDQIQCTAPICPDTLYFRGSGTEAFDELARARTGWDLLCAAHTMWCGPGCEMTLECRFLHYHDRDLTSRPHRTVRSRYSKDTAHLFGLMGGSGYQGGTSQSHEVNLWPLLEDVLAKSDPVRSAEGLVHCDYSDWTKKQGASANDTIAFACRDSIQWMANWCGDRYGHDPSGVRYVAFSTICDDICIPALDLVNERFRMYGRSVRDLMADMDRSGWGSDAPNILLALIRQYTLQYAEKAAFGHGHGHRSVHDQLNEASGVWDSVVYRTHTANTYGASVVVGRTMDSGPVTETWLMDSSICDAISMDLCKSALRVYAHDDHMPTANAQTEREREGGYHSVYLDLIDDLVATGAPDATVHFGRSGFLFVQVQDRYQERRAGRRFAITPTMNRTLGDLFGTSPADPLIDGLFRLQHLARQDRQEHTGPVTTPESLSARLAEQAAERMNRRAQSYVHHDVQPPHRDLPAPDGEGRCACARSWIHAVHALAAKADSPQRLHDLLTGQLLPGTPHLTPQQYQSLCPSEDAWAAASSCQIACGAEACEWAVYADHAWNTTQATGHTCTDSRTA